MNKKLLIAGIGLAFSMSACHDDDDVTVPFPVENPAEVASRHEVALAITVLASATFQSQLFERRQR